jgi:aspartate racemase
MHKVADAIEAAIDVPFMHIADTVGAAVVGEGITTVGLLGTRFTMGEAFYRDRLAERFGLRVLVPEAPERDLIDRVIYTELCCGVLDRTSRAAFVGIIERLVERGAQGIILGCTEIPLLVSAGDVDVPLFDTGEIHARAAVDFALGN